MTNTKVTVDYNYRHDAFKTLECGDYFTAKNEYGTYLYLYINDDCIMNVEEGIQVYRDYFSTYEEIRIIKKLKIIIEE